MKLFRSKPPEGPNRGQALACRPLVSPEVRRLEQPGGGLRLCYLITFKPWFAGLAGSLGLWKDGRVQEKKLDLDEMGRFSFELIDGTRNVRQIAELLAARYQLGRSEAEASLGVFLRELGKRGIILMLD